MKNIALIEFSNGHFECLYSHANILHQAGYQVHFIAPDCHLQREAELGIPLRTEKYIAGKSLFAELRAILRVKKYLRQHQIRQVIINTFAGRAVKLFMLLAGKLEVHAICHEVNKLKKGSWHKLAQRCQTIFVLNDYLIQNNPIAGIQLQSFYPIFFPAYPAAALQKPADEFWICIPGQLEYKRRAYLELLAMLPPSLDRRIKFVLLGNSRHKHGDGADFETRLTGYQDNFVIYRQFVSDEEFHHTLQQCDLIMPCLGNNPRYLQSGVSGAFNLAFAYHIPMLIEPQFMAHDDFQCSAFAYSADNFSTLLMQLLEQPALLKEKAAAMRHCPKFSFAWQSQHFLAALTRGASTA